ncbi:sensor histidine kinase [Flavobacterium azooxidireducens]|uniref:Sensor histidine kinase n=1 Tax=Flavobacterium azooxidireducens TaxID=1871076 RepID=A0ABY4KBC9_9FLAO|nr:sensor histidine kinase [Flavobacterium azooxidireducens]UPQ78096.1 sensor histidine kinase [Flavobacterium azooxidireducens]
MRVNLVIIFLVAILVQSTAQNRDKNVDVGPEFKKLITELDECIKAKDQNCLEISDKIIKKGKKEKVPFLDYLYFKRAFYFFNRNELDSTMVYSRLAVQNLNPVEKQRSDVAAYNLLANCYYFKGELNSAITIYLKIAAILENGGNQLHLGYLYSNIATLLGQTGNKEKQLDYLHKSFKLLKESNDERFIATVASNLGLAYYHAKDTVKTNKWAKEAVELSELSNDLVAKTQSNLTLSLIQKDLNKSLEYAEQSVKYADELKDKTHMTSAYYRYADALDKLGEGKKAINYAEQAVKFAEEIGDNLTLTNAAATAGKIYYNLGQKEKAADFYYTYSILKDSISSAENAREINDINTKYQTEKKEKQIIEQDLKIQKQQSNLLYAIFGGLLLLSIFGGIFIYYRKSQHLKLKQFQQEKENAILNSFILGEERERGRISHELHDGVAAMIGAAKMSLESIPHLPKEKQMQQLSKVQGILEHSHADIRHIAHNLLPTVLEKEGLIQATEQFVSEINETKLVHIAVTDKNSQANENSKQLQLMLFRIIQELVNNIIKHSQAQNAEIVFSKINNALQIEVIDDGLGYSDTITKENQGLYSISQRLKSIGGNFKITNGNAGGTRAKVELNV